MALNADYVRIGMKTLAKRAGGKAASGQQRQMKSMKPENVNQSLVSATGKLSLMLSASKFLNEQVSLPMEDYFDQIDMGIYVRHSPDDDSFQFPLLLRSLLPESFLAESVRVQMLGVEEDQRFELWLHADDQTIEPGVSEIWLGSNVSRL